MNFSYINKESDAEEFENCPYCDDGLIQFDSERADGMCTMCRTDADDHEGDE